MTKVKVYFMKDITKENLVKIYQALGKELKGKVAVKVHSGEDGNQNYLHPEFMQDIINYVKGTVVECNTAYDGARNTTLKHEELMKKHQWSTYFAVDIMDSKEDVAIDIPDGKVIKKNYVGKNLFNYDSMLVLSHFKGHPMGGYGGALKQLSIGISSSKGKRYIHCAGKENASYEDMFRTDQISFLEAMADAASSITKHFKDNILYINVLANLSVDCDCCAVAKDPCMADIGILASIDPVAIDKASIDLVKNSNDPGKEELLARIKEKSGEHLIEAAEKLGIGTTDYELIEL